MADIQTINRSADGKTELANVAAATVVTHEEYVALVTVFAGGVKVATWRATLAASFARAEETTNVREIAFAEAARAVAGFAGWVGQTQRRREASRIAGKGRVNPRSAIAW